MLWAIVMAGGWGTRLWPLSTKKRPKPLLKLFPGGKTLLEETLARLDPIVPPARTLVIGHESHVTELRKCAPGVPRMQVIGEPDARNTAPTVALGAKFALEQDPEAVILVLPADHKIDNRRKFQAAVKSAERMAVRRHTFSVFGVVPTFPSSSYGYVQMGPKIAGDIYELKRFVEKPSTRRARTFMRSGKFLWHAGIFLAEASTVLASLLQYEPVMAHRLSRIRIHQGSVKPRQAFLKLPSLSFDCAVLERLSGACLVRARFDWSDIGTWQTLSGFWPQDKFQNAALGSSLAIEASGNLIYVKNKFACLYGVKDLVVIDTPEVLFIGRKSASEEMRRVAEQAASRLSALTLKKSRKKNNDSVPPSSLRFAQDRL